MCFSLFMVVQRTLNTAREGIAADAFHAVGDGDGGQAAATFEGTVADAGHAVGDGDGDQALTISKGTVADAGHAVSLFIICNS